MVLTYPVHWTCCPWPVKIWVETSSSCGWVVRGESLGVPKDFLNTRWSSQGSTSTHNLCRLLYSCEDEASWWQQPNPAVLILLSFCYHSTAGSTVDLSFSVVNLHCETDVKCQCLMFWLYSHSTTHSTIILHIYSHSSITDSILPFYSWLYLYSTAVSTLFYCWFSFYCWFYFHCSSDSLIVAMETVEGIPDSLY